MLLDYLSEKLWAPPFQFLDIVLVEREGCELFGDDPLVCFSLSVAGGIRGGCGVENALDEVGQWEGVGLPVDFPLDLVSVEEGVIGG